MLLEEDLALVRATILHEPAFICHLILATYSTTCCQAPQRHPELALLRAGPHRLAEARPRAQTTSRTVTFTCSAGQSARTSGRRRRAARSCRKSLRRIFLVPKKSPVRHIQTTQPSRRVTADEKKRARVLAQYDLKEAYEQGPDALYFFYVGTHSAIWVLPDVVQFAVNKAVPPESHRAVPVTRRRVDPLMSRRLRYAGIALPESGDIFDPDAEYCLRMMEPQREAASRDIDQREWAFVKRISF